MIRVETDDEYSVFKLDPCNVSWKDYLVCDVSTPFFQCSVPVADALKSASKLEVLLSFPPFCFGNKGGVFEHLLSRRMSCVNCGSEGIVCHVLWTADGNARLGLTETCEI